MKRGKDVQKGLNHVINYIERHLADNLLLEAIIEYQGCHFIFCVAFQNGFYNQLPPHFPAGHLRENTDGRGFQNRDNGPDDTG